MPTFVHIADERNTKAIRRGGLRLPRIKRPRSELLPIGIFALPVTSNFLVSHQWLRELKRRGFRVAVGVHFRVSATELVWAGKYNEPRVQMTAAQAADRLEREQTLGFELILERSVRASEILSVKALPQTVGWRYFPEAHEQGIFCCCRFCQRGNFNSRRLQRAHGEAA